MLAEQRRLKMLELIREEGSASVKEVILVADSTKIGKVSFASLGGLNLIHSFITDDAIADEDRRRFEDMGVKVILAK